MKTLKVLPAILLGSLLLTGACTKNSCPTYSHSRDTVLATYADLALYMSQDTTPHKFKPVEKTLAVLGIIFVVYAADKNRQETKKHD